MGIKTEIEEVMFEFVRAKIECGLSLSADAKNQYHIGHYESADRALAAAEEDYQIALGALFSTEEISGATRRTAAQVGMSQGRPRRTICRTKQVGNSGIRVRCTSRQDA